MQRDFREVRRRSILATALPMAILFLAIVVLSFPPLSSQQVETDLRNQLLVCLQSLASCRLKEAASHVAAYGITKDNAYFEKLPACYRDVERTINALKSLNVVASHSADTTIEIAQRSADAMARARVDAALSTSWQAYYQSINRDAGELENLLSSIIHQKPGSLQRTNQPVICAGAIVAAILVAIILLNSLSACVASVQSENFSARKLFFMGALPVFVPLILPVFALVIKMQNNSQLHSMRYERVQNFAKESLEVAKLYADAVVTVKDRIFDDSSEVQERFDRLVRRQPRETAKLASFARQQSLRQQQLDEVSSTVYLAVDALNQLDRARKDGDSQSVEAAKEKVRKMHTNLQNALRQLTARGLEINKEDVHADTLFAGMVTDFLLACFLLNRYLNRVCPRAAAEST